MIKWARSVLDWHNLDRGYRSRDLVVWPYHALDEGDVHPHGVYRTQCGHSLIRNVTLYEQPPGLPCPQCAIRLASGTCPHCGDRAPQHRPEVYLSAVGGQGHVLRRIAARPVVRFNGETRLARIQPMVIS